MYLSFPKLFPYIFQKETITVQSCYEFFKSCEIDIYVTH